MPFQKGKPKTGGIKKGQEHKATRDIKEAYKMLIEKNLDNLTVWLEQVAQENPEKAIKCLIDLTDFVVPKLKSVESKNEVTIQEEKKTYLNYFPPREMLKKKNE